MFATSIAAAQRPSTVTGDLRLHILKFGEQERTIRVWVPPGYDASGDQRYPVVYLHDAQHLFDAAISPSGEWKVDETLTQMARADEIDVPIVVGIDEGSATRIQELTYTQDGGRGGGGAAYEQFVVANVLPFVEKTYRVRSDRDGRIIGGSSLGATMSLELAMRHPELFAKVIAMSPSLWWDRQSLMRFVLQQPEALARTTIWLDIGEREGPVGSTRKALVDLTRGFSEILSAQGVPHQLVVDPIGEHNEASWARRFPAVMRYLLPPPPGKSTQPATRPAGG